MSTIANVLPRDHGPSGVVAPASRASEMSPKAKARLAGVLFLVTIVGGVVAQGLIGDRLVVTGDAAATARNFAANKTLIRLAYAIFMIEMACQTATTGLLYDLLTPVNASVARAMAAFGYVGAGIKAMARLFFYAPLFVLSGASYLTAFDARQLEVLAYLLIRLNAQGTQVAVVFLGISTVLTGCLMVRASFLPRVLGVLSLVGGPLWMAWIYPPLGSRVFLAAVAVALVGCAVTIGWLLVRGVDEEKWHAMTAAASAARWR